MGSHKYKKASTKTPGLNYWLLFTDSGRTGSLPLALTCFVNVCMTISAAESIYLVVVLRKLFNLTFVWRYIVPRRHHRWRSEDQVNPPTREWLFIHASMNYWLCESCWRMGLSTPICPEGGCRKKAPAWIQGWRPQASESRSSEKEGQGHKRRDNLTPSLVSQIPNVSFNSLWKCR